MMKTVVIFSPQKSARLSYILEWIFNDIFHIGYTLVHNEEEVTDLPFFIAYGRHFENALSIPDNGLLWQKNISEHNIALGKWKNIPTLYHAENNFVIPFDIFSAVFFLISRYEEYYPFTPDKHNRYPAIESFLYKNNLLQRPLIDEWLFELYGLLKEKNIAVALNDFHFQPSYDIDIAFSYKYKGWKRNVGGFVKSFIEKDFTTIKERWNTLNGKIKDPFDSFDFLNKLHKANNSTPLFFILAALKNSTFDKNIAPQHPQMNTLIVQLASNGMIGLHPSYFSDNTLVFKEEKNMLENIVGHTITRSRQHYIKMKLPETYQLLIARNISDDYSMGYGAALGFRAGTGRSFKWYDLSKEEAANLNIHPFCFMDTTALFEEGLNVEEAFLYLEEMKKILHHTHSKLTTVFHNFSLGSDKEWKGWRDAYRLNVISN